MNIFHFSAALSSRNSTQKVIVAFHWELGTQTQGHISIFCSLCSCCSPLANSSPLGQRSGHQPFVKTLFGIMHELSTANDWAVTHQETETNAWQQFPLPSLGLYSHDDEKSRKVSMCLSITVWARPGPPPPPSILFVHGKKHDIWQPRTHRFSLCILICWSHFSFKGFWHWKDYWCLESTGRCWWFLMD